MAKLRVMFILFKVLEQPLDSKLLQTINGCVKFTIKTEQRYQSESKISDM